MRNKIYNDIRMDFKKTIIAALVVLTCAPAKAQTDGKWTLDDCITYAVENNITLKKSSLSRQSTAEDVLQSRSALLPSLSASTTQSIGWRPWINDATSTVTNGTVATKSNKTYYNGSYGVNVNWTVWDGNQNRNTLKYNKMEEESAELDSATQANTLKEQIAQLYVQILYTTEAIEVNKQSHEASVKNEEQGKVMYEVGNMSKADLAQLTAQVAQEAYNIVNSETQLANYKMQLRQLLELDGMEEFDIYVPEMSDEMALAEIPSLQGVYEAALSYRPEIASSQLAIKSSDLNISIAKAGWWPTLALSASVGSSTTSMSDLSWGKQFKTNFDAGLGLTVSIPIFDNRSTRTSVNKARIQYEQAQLDLIDARKTLWETIEGYWLDATNNQAMFKSASASARSQQESYDLLSEQFELGLKNIVELMTGKSNLLDALQEKLQSKYSAILDIKLLEFYEDGSMK